MELSKKDQKFKEILNQSNYHGTESTLVPRYQHVERIENEEVDGLLKGTVYIQHKIDGANLSVWRENGLMRIASRKNIIHTDEGGPINNFNGAAEYCCGHGGIDEVSNRWILRGEWLIKHTINYPAEVYKKFYVFDVQEYDTLKYITPDDYIPVLEDYEIVYVPILAKLHNPTLKEIISYLDGPDFLGAPQKEGIVIKNYDYMNKYGKVKWGKIVSSSFKEKNKAIFGPSSKKEVEALFAKEIDEHLVYKTIEKIAQEQNITIERKNIPEILGRVWYDLFTENLWNFTKKNKVGQFDFKLAQKYAYVRTRDFILEYFDRKFQERIDNE